MAETKFAPVFAVVGHPNEGKSSVVSTLTEDDSVPVSPLPGETRRCHAYPICIDGQEVLRFVDTPGFQNPGRVLSWMRAQPQGTASLAALFVATYQSELSLRHDVELLRPLASGSGIIYVVDGSRPIRNHDRAEMEVLRLIGNPRMAILNFKEQDRSFLEEWKHACARSFNSTRVFDAHRATFAERLALFESLKAIHQDWERSLGNAISAFEADWQRRNRLAAAAIASLIADALTLRSARNLSETANEDEVKAKLLEDYRHLLQRREKEAQREIRALFKHNIFRPAVPEQSILHEDLFTEKTWRFLGLNRRQIIMAAAVVGGGVGAKLDVVFAHLSFGIFTLSGAALSVIAAWLRGDRLARVKVKRIPLGGLRVTVGPNTNPQFPFVLLDRTLLYYQYAINWAHARRAPDEPGSTEISGQKQGFSSNWTPSRRRVCLDYIRSLRRENPAKRAVKEGALVEMLYQALGEISTSR